MSNYKCLNDLHLPLSLSTNFGHILYGFCMPNITNIGTNVNIKEKLIRGRIGYWFIGIISTNRETHTMTNATGKINKACI